MKRWVIFLSILAVAWLLVAAANGQARRKSRKPPVSRFSAAILTPRPGPAPRINGPKVYGCRPGNPFIYRIPTTGKRPMVFSARKLPPSLALDKLEGIITGTTPPAGEYPVTLIARNREGDSTRPFKIVSGDKLALTPPMGWNHWYAHYNRITDGMVRQAAEIMVSSGMADAGYQYVNIDDCWMNSASGENPKRFDPKRVGPVRDVNGDILPNKYFPDMRALTDFIHSKGLKAGIYTSPGPKTCAGYAGSYGHEAADARQFAEWGFDFLKYDWCSYGEIAPGDKSLETLQKPYRLMGEILRSQKRDIVYNLCQYGMGKVWEWGAEVGAQSWRTAGDLGFELDRIVQVALKNTEHRAYSKPGSWNDPDYIQIGYIGDARTSGVPKACPMSPNEQYAFMSLWCLMAAPLFYSGDMTRLDAFTLNVLCNPEVIEVDQDPLGRCGAVQHLDEFTFLMVKILEDGSKAVGLFNQKDTDATVTADWPALGIRGRSKVRDLWRQRDLGVFDGEFQAKVPARGVVLVRISPIA
ncbi:MAG: putative Ig domain-containing protein [Acidobacteriota bacterium]